MVKNPAASQTPTRGAALDPHAATARAKSFSNRSARRLEMPESDRKQTTAPLSNRHKFTQWRGAVLPPRALHRLQHHLGPLRGKCGAAAAGAEVKVAVCGGHLAHRHRQTGFHGEQVSDFSVGGKFDRL